MTNILLFIAIIANLLCWFYFSNRESKRKGFMMGVNRITYALNESLDTMLRDKTIDCETAKRLITDMNHFLGLDNRGEPYGVSIEKTDDLK